MAPGIDMLHHFGPLTRSKSSSTHGLLDANAGNRDSFDYSRFRRHFATLFDRIVRLASSPVAVNPEKGKEEPSTEEKLPPTQQVDEIGNMQRMLGEKGLPLAPPKRRANMSSSWRQWKTMRSTTRRIFARMWAIARSTEQPIRRTQTTRSDPSG